MSLTKYPELHRKPNGIPVNGQGLVAADLVALVAGVSGGSVARVLIALEAVSEGLGIPVAELTHSSRVPSRGPDEQRLEVTENFAQDLADMPHLMQRYEADLNFLHRHSKKGKS